MSLISNEALIGAAGSGVSAYQIEQSLRFDGSSYLTRTPSSAGNQRTLTFSWWTKGTHPSTDQAWLVVRQAITPYMFINRNIFTDVLDVVSNTFGGNFTAAYRDTSAWYHYVLRFDTGNATQSERVILYVNGVRQPNYGDPGSVSQNADTLINSTIKHTIGADSTYTQSYLKGYMAEVHLVDGTALNATDFGEFDDNGVWRPIEVSGLTYGTNGFYLKFDPSATNGIGHDHSGNGNHFTASGFTTSGTETDVKSDTPTTNWCTLNPLWNPIEATYAEGNLKFTGGATHSPSASSISASSGKYYFEATALSGSLLKWSLGIIDTAITYRKSSGNNYIPGYVPNNVYSAGDAISLYDNTIYKNGSSLLTSVFSGGAVAAGDIVQMAVDIDAGKIWFGIDGTWNNGGGTEGAFNPSGHDTTFTANEDYIFHFTAESCGWEVNFGQRDFTYTPPTGFKALNTKNLPAPTIKDGSDYFNTVLWTGNGVDNRSITGVGFQPDFLWHKRRNASGGHQLLDVIRGVTVPLFTHATAAEGSESNSVKAFETDGFQVGTDSNINGSGTTYVAWNWIAGGSGSSNTSGSITSTVSANPSAGFSIVTYTGSNSNATIGHGLGVAPRLIIVKDRDTTSHWFVYHGSLGATKGLSINLSTKQETNSGYWNNTAPTSSVFTVGTHAGTGGSTNDYIAYCFAEVEGYSRMSTYSANGSTDGPFIYCGFRPAFILIKNYAGGSETPWVIYDTARDTYNLSQKRLFPNLTATEESDSTRGIDILSNGFKIKNNHASINESGSDYLFLAFAENPFGGSGVSPVTAR